MNGVIGQVCRLFQDYPDLLVGFNCFLPEGHRMPMSGAEHLAAQAQAQAAPFAAPPPMGVGAGPGPAGHAGGGNKQALQISDAMKYMDKVRDVFSDRPEVYMQFLDIMKNFQAQR
jgi:histone deacetylase complex regulatory component SIN3